MKYALRTAPSRFLTWSFEPDLATASEEPYLREPAQFPPTDRAPADLTVGHATWIFSYQFTSTQTELVDLLRDTLTYVDGGEEKTSPN